MLERLQAAATVQQQPIDDASHELRTPLAILVTSADVTLDDPGATMTSYATGLERSRAAAERMTTVVDDLLVGARQRARTIDRELIDLSELAVEAADSMRPLAISRSVVIVVAEPTPVLCNADHASITRALTNPIDNAIFSPEDGTVTVAAIEESGFASVSVTDQGAVVA
ncbi:MAG: HAMP domain-containing sensor histidine kinase, partial [Acidimicrobiia bacterium]|nr:HAMP domain-containing sensor histidine kinase [Acidimicrobiia bacterium]